MVAIRESGNREKEQMCTLTTLSLGQKSGKQKKRNQQQQAEEVVLAAPVNQKLPWMDLEAIPAEFGQDREEGKKPGRRYYIAKLTEWREDQRRPVCKITECIGEAGNLEAESMRLLRTHDICTEAYENEDQEPTANVHECLRMFLDDIDPETKEWKIPQSEIEKRLDLRQRRIFTIDPATAKDLDDALSIEKISSTICEIGVHIADVSYFVQQGTELDKEAQKRCTSTYFVHKVFPMLPRLLCERLCSLNPKVDRLAYSVFFRMDMRKGQLDASFEPKMVRSVIRTCAKWNYDLVQQILDGLVTSEDQLEPEQRPQGHSFKDMVADCFLMNGIAQLRRKRRFENGSVSFLNREFTFQLDEESRLPLKYRECERMESKALVEEYMLLANILVAERLFKFCKDKALLRAHDDISEEKKEKLMAFFEKVGIQDVDLTSAETVSHSLE